MTMTIDQVELKELEALLSGDSLCEISQENMPHPCSSYAAGRMLLRCEGHEPFLVCRKWMRYFEEALVPDLYLCSYCSRAVVRCWRIVPA